MLRAKRHRHSGSRRRGPAGDGDGPAARQDRHINPWQSAGRVAAPCFHRPINRAGGSHDAGIVGEENTRRARACRKSRSARTERTPPPRSSRQVHIIRSPPRPDGAAIHIPRTANCAKVRSMRSATGSWRQGGIGRRRDRGARRRRGARLVRTPLVVAEASTCSRGQVEGHRQDHIKSASRGTPPGWASRPSDHG